MDRLRFGHYHLVGKLKSEIIKRNPPQPSADNDNQPIVKVTQPNGSAAAVKGLRQCFYSLLQEHTDNHFTGRLMKLVTHIYSMDKEGEKCKKSVLFSQHPLILRNLVFHVRVKEIEQLYFQFEYFHDPTRSSATLKLNDFYIKNPLLPQSVTHYRIFNHLSIISDYSYSESTQAYMPLSELNTSNTISYSDYIERNKRYTGEIITSFPDKITLSVKEIVIQCIGIEYFSEYNSDNFARMHGGGVMIMDVF